MSHSEHEPSRWLRVGAIVFLSLSLAAVGVVAQEAEPLPPVEEHAGPHHVGVVARVLRLTPDQVAAWEAILRDAHDAVEPLVEEVRAKEAELGELLGSEDPDPTEVGELMLQIRDLREEIRAIHRQATEDFLALLDEQQMVLMRRVRLADRFFPVVPSFRALGLV